MPMTKSQNINSSEYVTIKHRPLSFVRGQKKLPPQEGQGESLNAFINRAITEAMERDNTK